jgi:hypothetical protein
MPIRYLGSETFSSLANARARFKKLVGVSSSSGMPKSGNVADELAIMIIME